MIMANDRQHIISYSCLFIYNNHSFIVMEMQTMVEAVTAT